MPADRPRRKADELLLRRGPLPRERVLLEIAGAVQPGEAVRRGLKSRVTSDDDERYASRREDPARVGARSIANQVIGNALKYGVWVLEDGIIRHRDWVEPEPMSAIADIPEPAGWAVPSLDEVRSSAPFTSLTKWHWAAIVATYVEVGEGRGNSVNVNSDIRAAGFMPPSEFAELGVAGLASRNTVRRYWKVWMDHSGGHRPQPGEPVDIPDTPFPSPTPTPADVRPPTPVAKPKQDGRPRQPKKGNQDEEAWRAWLLTQNPPEFWEGLFTRPRRVRTRAGNVTYINREGA